MTLPKWQSSVGNGKVSTFLKTKLCLAFDFQGLCQKQRTSSSHGDGFRLFRHFGNSLATTTNKCQKARRKPPHLSPSSRSQSLGTTLPKFCRKDKPKRFSNVTTGQPEAMRSDKGKSKKKNKPSSSSCASQVLEEMRFWSSWAKKYVIEKQCTNLITYYDTFHDGSNVFLTPRLNLEVFVPISTTYLGIKGGPILLEYSRLMKLYPYMQCVYT